MVLNSNSKEIKEMPLNILKNFTESICVIKNIRNGNIIPNFKS